MKELHDEITELKEAKRAVEVDVGNPWEPEPHSVAGMEAGKLAMESEYKREVANELR